MRSSVVDLLDDLAAGLNGLGVAWYLFGARAAILYGVARLTADIDVTVRVPAGLSTNAVVEALGRHGFRARIADTAFIERTRVVPIVHNATSIPVDLVLAGPGLEDQFFERAVVHDLDGVLVPVASPEDLVVMKILAGRPKDQDDAIRIVASNSDTLDLAYVRRTLKTLEQAIGQSDLLPAFERACIEAARRESP